MRPINHVVLILPHIETDLKEAVMLPLAAHGVPVITGQHKDIVDQLMELNGQRNHPGAVVVPTDGPRWDAVLLQVIGLLHFQRGAEYPGS
jgi:spore coat polysaccharide biosynthesis protein SpsF (cytidylyltransferase family)